jgi:hypothetical protein
VLPSAQDSRLVDEPFEFRIAITYQRRGRGVLDRRHDRRQRLQDVRVAGQLFEGVACRALLGDKGYDADVLIERLRRARIAVVIPPRSNRKDKRGCDFIFYKERNLIGSLRKTQAISCDTDTPR